MISGETWFRAHACFLLAAFRSRLANDHRKHPAARSAPVPHSHFPIRTGQFRGTLRLAMGIRQSARVRVDAPRQLESPFVRQHEQIGRLALFRRSPPDGRRVQSNMHLNSDNLIPWQTSSAGNNSRDAIVPTAAGPFSRTPRNRKILLPGLIAIKQIFLKSALHFPSRHFHSKTIALPDAARWGAAPLHSRSSATLDRFKSAGMRNLPRQRGPDWGRKMIAPGRPASGGWTAMRILNPDAGLKSGAIADPPSAIRRS